MSEKKSIIEEALLESEEIKKTFEANAKEILANTMKSEIEEMVKESLETEAEVEEEEEVIEETEEVTSETDLDLTELDLDVESNVDVVEESESPEVIDLTNKSDEEVMAIFKEMGPQDEIEVVQEGETEVESSNLDNTDSENDEVYEIELNSNKDEEEIVYEIEISDEPLTEDEDSMDYGMDGEESEEGGSTLEKLLYRFKDAIEDTIEDIGGEEEEGDEIDMGAPEDMGEPEDMGAPEDMGEPEGSGELEIIGEPEDADGMDYDSMSMGEMASMINKEYRVPHRKIKEMTYGQMKEMLKNHKNEASRGMSAQQRLVGNRTASGNQRRMGESIEERKPRNLISENRDLKSKLEVLTEQNEEFKGALKSFREKLSEVAVFNSNLAYATKLFTEHTTTKEEKTNILKRFDEVTNLKESKSLYKTIVGELDNVSKTTIKESIEDKITKTPKSGAITESKVYVDPSVEKMRRLWSYNYGS